MDSLYVHENGVGFRKAEKTDAKSLLDLKNESWFGTHTVTLANLASQEKWLESISYETHCPRNLVLMASNGPITFGIFKILNVDWQSRKAEVGWDIFKCNRGKGLGKKLVKAGVDFAFEVLNLRRLDAQILVTNQRSLACAQASGFEIEGTQRRAIFKKNEYIDNLLLGLLRQ